MALFQPEEKAAVAGGPMVDGIVGQGVTEVTQHEARGEGQAQDQARICDGRSRGQDQDDHEAQPRRRAKQGLLVIVMLGMLVLDVRQVMQHVAMHDVLDERPASEADHQGDEHGQPVGGCAVKGIGDQNHGQRRIDVEIGKKTGRAQVHRTRLGVTFVARGGCFYCGGAGHG